MGGKRFETKAGLWLAGALAATALAACERGPSLSPAQEDTPPPPHSETLAGAPNDAPAPPPAVEPAPPPVAYAEAPPPPEPPPPPRRPGDGEVIYDLGPVVRPESRAMPVERPVPRRAEPRYEPAAREPAPDRHHRHHAYAAPARPPAARPTAHAHAHPAPAHPPAPAVRAPVAPVRPAAPRAVAPMAKPAPVRAMPAPVRATPAPAAKPIAPAPVKPVVARPATPVTHPAAPVLAPAAPNLAAAKPAKPAPVVEPRMATPLHAPKHGKPTAANKAERSAALAGLQTSLRDAVAHSATLSVPALKPDQPADVSLTLPADFARTVRDEATKQNLGDAAASVNITSLLGGDGYAVAPDETQSQPLTVGQPTEFHWTVTAQPGARGALHADVGADLLGGGSEALQLGTVQAAPKSGFHMSSRAWGALLLVVIAVILFAWLGRGGRGGGGGRSRDARRDAERRNRETYGADRPLDMGPQRVIDSDPGRR